MLQDCIAAHRPGIIRRCRMKVATRPVPPDGRVQIDEGVPAFLRQLEDALRARLIPSSDIARTAVQQGHQLRHQGFTVSDVVHHYADVCQTITELAVELDEAINTDDFRMLNLCLDDAIAGLGLGLAFSRSAVEATNGRVSARNLPEKGCIFTIDLPRILTPAVVQ